MRKFIIAAIIALLAGISVMFYAGKELLSELRMTTEANAAYDGFSETMRKAAAVEIGYLASGGKSPEAAMPDADGIGAEAEPQIIVPDIYIPDFEIDFEALRMINEDAAAWLYGPGTAIDYPVMMADDYKYYLNHLIDGKVNANGSIFIDYNNDPGFGDELTVVYGHNMKSGNMFGSLKNYKKQAYYDEHPYIYLYTEQGNYRIDLIYGFVISAGTWSERAFMHAENVGSLLDHAQKNTTFISDYAHEKGDRIIALSTCSYEFNNARYVVVGVLRGG